MFSQAYLDYQKNNYKSDSDSGTKAVQVPGTEAEFQADKYVDMVIVPYRAGQNNPLVLQKIIAPGDWVNSLDLWVHRNIGPNKNEYICNKNFNKPCPLCDLQNQIFRSHGKDIAKKLKASKRSWFNICLTDQQGRNYSAMQFFNPSYVLFTEVLLEAAITKTRGASMLTFADVERGHIVSFHTIEEAIGKTKFISYGNFEFVDRAPLPPQMVADAKVFEDYMQILSTAQLKELLDEFGLEQQTINAGLGRTLPPPSDAMAGQPTPAYGYSAQPQVAPQPAAGGYPATPPSALQPNYGSPEPRGYTSQPISTPPVASGYNTQPQPAYTPTPAADVYGTDRPATQPPTNARRAVVQEAQVLQPTQGEALVCPSGLAFGKDINTSRHCNFCEVWNECDRAKKAGG